MDVNSIPVLERPVLKIGNQGEYVFFLQTILQQLMFYFNDINGVFDSNTQQSVKSFQTNNRLTSDGVVGKDTWSALIYLYSQLPICEDNVHIVQRGDTLWSIARKYNTIVEQIMRVNNLTSSALTIGQRLIIPGTEEVEEDNIYIVQRGDTLWAIANRFNTSVEELRRLNYLTSNVLNVGQRLIIPTTTNTYTVQRGDSLWSIANRFNTTVSALRAINNLTSDILRINQVLIIPNK